MPDDAGSNNAPPLVGALLSNWGPPDGRVLGPDASGTVSAMAEGEAAMLIGIAHPLSLLEHPGGLATTFGLVVSKVEHEGGWMCVRRSFVRLGDAAEEL
jgi:hypothetical protein